MEQQICVNCGSETPIRVFVKYYRDDSKIHLGGDELRGPICQPCLYNISDAASGKPPLIKQEHEQLNRRI